MCKTNRMVVSAWSLLVAVPAIGGASLDTALNGDSLFNAGDEIESFDSKLTPILNLDQATDTDAEAISSTLLFAGTEAAKASGDFEAVYDAAGADTLLEAIEPVVASGGSSIDSEREKIATNQRVEFGVFTNSAGGGASAGGAGGVGGGGGGGGSAEVETKTEELVYSELADVYFTEESVSEQKVVSEQVTPSSAPSPTAALAGMALLGVMGLRRRRRD
ncbi:MAG: MYXO-CTERM sorting domain-containing protein [Planctomycetota bacterium]